MKTCKECGAEHTDRNLMCADSGEHVSNCSIHQAKGETCPEVYCEDCWEEL